MNAIETKKKVNCILLIDDNPADNRYHKICIDESELCEHVAIATDGKSALEYLKKCGDSSTEFPRPDMIFLDINMPGMNGFEFLDEYQKLDKKIKSKVLVIMLSTSLNPDDQKRALSYNEVVEFQNKPLETDSLVRTIGKYF